MYQTGIKNKMAFKYDSNYYDLNQFFSIASKPNRLNLFNNFTFTYKLYPMYMFYLIYKNYSKRINQKHSFKRGMQSCLYHCITCKYKFHITYYYSLLLFVAELKIILMG